MGNTDSEEKIMALVSQARRRSVVFVPAGLSANVAHAIAKRMEDVPELALTVIIDSTPGVPDTEAFDILRNAAATSNLPLRIQPGVGIGAIIADDAFIPFDIAP